MAVASRSWERDVPRSVLVESRRTANGHLVVTNLEVGRGVRLPIAGGERPERVDAARNRRKILDAAQQLIADRGVAGFSMNDVAEAAGVGVGTLYRRFGDRAGLAYALLDEWGREFQAAFLYGPPPLGPGAAPLERIRAFLHAYVDDLEEHLDLWLAAESASSVTHHQSSDHEARLMHVLVLVRQVCPDADAEYLAQALLAPLASELYAHQRSERGMSPDRIKAGLDQVLRCLEGDGHAGN